MDKYGFVYLWRDRKHKRYYLGSHWGTEFDGYVCSSSWMMKAYKIRPADFRRKIIKRIQTNKKELLEIENKYLAMIKPEEIKIKYYNLRIHEFGHWSVDKDLTKTAIERIKMHHNTPEFKEKMRNHLLQNNPMHTSEIVEKVRLKNIGKLPWNTGLDKSDSRILQSSINQINTKKNRKYVAWNKGKKACYSEETLIKMSISNTGRKWYHNPSINKSKQFRDSENIEAGYIPGRGKTFIIDYDEELRKIIGEKTRQRYARS